MSRIEKRIKKLLGIPGKFKLYSLVKEERRSGKTYYKIVAYASGKGIRRFRVWKAVEPEVLRLWQEFEKERKLKKEFLKSLSEKLEKALGKLKYDKVEDLRKSLKEMIDDFPGV